MVVFEDLQSFLFKVDELLNYINNINIYGIQLTRKEYVTMGIELPRR